MFFTKDIYDYEYLKTIENQNLWFKSELFRPYSIGSCISILKNGVLNGFITDIESWEKYYIKTGEDRLKIIESPNYIKYKNLLINPICKSKYDIPKYIKNVNYDYGRTFNDIQNIASILYTMSSNNNNMFKSQIDAIKFVYLHTIIETWEGYNKENNLIHYLNGQFSDYYFEHESAVNDSKYGSDIRVLKNNNLVCSIQLKPYTYFLSNRSHLIEARKHNIINYKKYFDDFNAPIKMIVYFKSEYDKSSYMYSHTFYHSKYINEDGTVKDNIFKEKEKILIELK